MFYLVNLNEVGWQKLDYEQVVDESLNEVRAAKTRSEVGGRGQEFISLDRHVYHGESCTFNSIFH